MADEFRIKISDTFGNSLTFSKPQELERFLRSEIDAWSWLAEAPHTFYRPNIIAPVSMRNAVGWLGNLDNRTWNQSDFQNNFGPLFQNMPLATLLSDFAPGANVLMIREVHGDAMAELAYALVTGQHAPNIANDIRAFRAIQMVANPTLIAPEAWADEHRRKLGNMRAAVTRDATLYEQNEEKRQSAAESALAEHRLHYRRLMVAAVRVAARRLDGMASSAKTAVAHMEATDAAYSLQMGLEAPVRYWRAKQRSHGKAAKGWGVALVLYALVAIIGSCFAVPAIWGALPADEALTGRHFVLVAAIGAALTTLFWIARLLVRIYLGERHLATDAEERRVMTQAYLALMKGDAASNEERAIILSALFRTAQDGIVREEGVGDVGLPAMLAKLLDSKK